MAGIKTMTDADYTYNPVWEMIFGSVVRPIWGFVMCWTIYACYYDGAGMSYKSIKSLLQIPFY